MRPEKRLEELEEALLHLRQQAEGAAVVVEGRKDAEALEALGIPGAHVKLHRGATIEDRIDAIAHQARQSSWSRVVLLVDWDRTGGRLAERLAQGLAPRVDLDLECRRRLAVASHTKCVEDIPADLAALRRRVGRG